MKVVFWGTRGSIAAPGPETVHYGGNTVCVEVRPAPDHAVVLDAGTGIRRLGAALSPDVRRIDLLLTHLHMDHIVGLGFFSALYQPQREVHIWGPASTTQDLAARLTRYLSPPLFPVRVRDLDCELRLHDVPLGTFDIPNLVVQSALVSHPGPTVGFRLEHAEGVMTYLTDHEPALGVPDFPDDPRWTSGYDLAHRADLLVHDAMFADDQYAPHEGWGHSSIGQAIAFATLAEVRHLVTFHHDPAYDDATMDRLYAEARATDLPFELTVACEGLELELSRASTQSGPAR